MFDVISFTPIKEVKNLTIERYQKAVQGRTEWQVTTPIAWGQKNLTTEGLNIT